MDGQEQLLLEEQGVIVTDARIVVPGRTYAVAHVTSVATARVQAGLLGPALVFAVGVLVSVLAFNGLAYGRASMGAAFLVILALGLLGGAVLLRVAPWRPYLLLLHTAGGEREVLSHRDRAFVRRVKGAVSEALVLRSSRQA